jgi:hypothetical protein
VVWTGTLALSLLFAGATLSAVARGEAEGRVPAPLAMGEAAFAAAPAEGLGFEPWASAAPFVLAAGSAAETGEGPGAREDALVTLERDNARLRALLGPDGAGAERLGVALHDFVWLVPGEVGVSITEVSPATARVTVTATATDRRLVLGERLDLSLAGRACGLILVALVERRAEFVLSCEAEGGSHRRAG